MPQINREEYESEETEVNKQKLIEKWESAIEDAEFYGKGKEDRLIEYMRDFVDDLNQLDEPEVEQLERKIKELDSYNDELIRDNNQFRNELDSRGALSEEWIERNTSPVDDEGRLYVWKSDLQNAIVPKPELPVVPTWFDKWWKDATKGGGNLFHNIERFYDELFSSGTRETYDYISSPDNKKNLLNIIINELDYVVEEEQKYYVINKQGAFALRKNTGGVANSIYTKKEVERLGELQYYQLTEQEIKDYDERYFAFAVKAEEL